MPAELTISAFISKFWGAIAAFGFFVFSHIRMNEKVEAQSKRIDRLESSINRDLSELKESVKALTHKVDANHNTMQSHHIEILNSLKSK